MKASEYKKLAIREITCPSGLQVMIRKIVSMDYLMLGILPDTLMEYQEKAANGQVDDPEMVAKLQKMYLTRAIIPTQDLRIVDKDPEKCAENELPIILLNETDILFLIKEISLFSFGEDSPKEGQFRDISEKSLATTS